eukprot:5817937-Amphidinium_carterae.2
MLQQAYMSTTNFTSFGKNWIFDEDQDSAGDLMGIKFLVGGCPCACRYSSELFSESYSSDPLLNCRFCGTHLVVLGSYGIPMHTMKIGHDGGIACTTFNCSQGLLG